MKADCSNPTPVEYKCKFCNKSGVAYYDAQYPDFKMDLWISTLACDRCADYHSRLDALIGSITAICRTHQIMSESKSQEVRDVSEKAAREKLTAKTHEYAKHVCGFRRMVTCWQQDFVDILMEKPREVIRVLRDYERRIESLSKASAMK